MGLELFSENFGELSQGRMEDCSSSLCDHEGGGLATESAAASMLVYEASAAKCLVGSTGKVQPQLSLGQLACVRPHPPPQLAVEPARGLAHSTRLL